MGSSRRAIIRIFNYLSHITFSFASAMIVSLFIGYCLDRWRGGNGFYLKLFFVFGILAGAKSLRRAVNEANDELQRKE